MDVSCEMKNFLFIYTRKDVKAFYIKQGTKCISIRPGRCKFQVHTYMIKCIYIHSFRSSEAQQTRLLYIHTDTTYSDAVYTHLYLYLYLYFKCI